MGKKIFKFMGGKPGEEAARLKGKGAPAEAEAAGHAESADRMRDLMRQHYGEDRMAILRELVKEGEGATKFNEARVEMEHVSAPETDMLQMISEQTGLRIVDLRKYPRVGNDLRRLLTPEQAKRLRAIPVEKTEDGTLVIAIADPSNPMISDDLRLIVGENVETVIAREDEIDERIESYYGMGDESIEDLVEKETEDEVDENVIGDSRASVDLADLDSISDDQPIIKLVNVLLLKAINDRASDIHIEPFPNFIRIRYRVDGVLREIPAPPRNMLIPIVSRIKVLSGMNISESRRPQDGRVKLSAGSGREVDMRISTVPTVHGEAVVMRVLDKGMMMIGISQIGMLGEVLERFKKLIRKPNGIVLVTGPTGSGKTTTLYAALAEVKDPGEKLITTEDPVEYELEGIQQVSINDNVGLTFARCLRAILRQDPDTVLVGEIRDVDTAQISVQAALTGHLVFSTLHTNSACATVTRLLDMGVEPFLITSALEGVIGQRLVRTVCQNCKVSYEPGEEELLDFNKTPEEVREEGITFYHGEGCSECNHSGYHGRMGIFELMTIDDEIRDMILERATTDEIQDVCTRKGMITMRQDGWVKACMGLTTLSEIARQTPKDTSAPGPREKLGLDTGSPESQIEGPEKTEALPEPQKQIEADQVAPAGEEAARSGH